MRILVILFLLVSSCGKLPGYETLNKQEAFIVNSQVNPDVDLLFVIDNSPSMANNQLILANSFSTFIDSFAQKGLHFHLGIVSTDQYGNKTDTIDYGSGGQPIDNSGSTQNQI